MSKKKSKKDKPTVNPELDGFNIEIDSFGEIKTNYDIDKINKFLNENVEDKKLIGRDDDTESDENNEGDDDSDQEK